MTNYATRTELSNYAAKDWIEKTTGTITSNNEATISVSFTDRSTRMLYIGAGSASSATADDMRAITILRNNLATGVKVATNVNISMSGTSLTITNSGNGTIRYVID